MVHLLWLVMFAWSVSAAALSTQGISTPAPASGLNNFRDLGGIPCSRGRTMRSGLLLRSASPANATEADVERLIDGFGLRTIVDLRAEADAAKDFGPQVLNAQFDSSQLRRKLHLSILDEEVIRAGLKHKALDQPSEALVILALAAFTKFTPSRRLRARARDVRDRRLASVLDSVGLQDLYWWMMMRRGEQISQALRLAAAPGSLPLLLHCTHGKDRTGVVVALLLHICGASRDDIAADYAASDEWGRSEQGRWLMLESARKLAELGASLDEVRSVPPARPPPPCAHAVRPPPCACTTCMRMHPPNKCPLRARDASAPVASPPLPGDRD